jgi:acetoacetate decarboxylase
MKIDDVRRNAYAMPLTNPSFPRGPYRFFDREYLIVTYRTDPEALRAVVPEPLEVAEPLVKYEFIRMPDSTGFGDYTESGQVIPVRFAGEDGVYVHSMYLDDDAPIAGGRELWGFPKKLAQPKISHEGEVISGTLHYGHALCALATMGYKHQAADKQKALRSLSTPNFVLKIIPHVDGTPRICELVRYRLEDIVLKEAWNAPAELQLFRHVMADVARLPVLEIVSGQHLIADLTLGYGEVAFDYLGKATERAAPRHSEAQPELTDVEG